MAAVPPQALATLPEAAYCVVSAAHRFALPPEAILAVLLQEGGSVGMKKRNSSNGSYDLGPMQVNTVWLDPKSPLVRYASEDLLANDLCHNIHTGAWIIAKHLQRTGDIWRAIGMYHSPRGEGLARKYVQNVNAKVPLARSLIAYNQNYQRYLAAFYPVSALDPSRP